MEVWTVSLFWFALMHLTGCMCYSNFNFGWIVYVLLFNRKHLVSFVTCNHIATITPWYVSWAMDPSIPSRMFQKYGWSARQFALGDLVLHVMPTLAVVYMNAGLRGTPQIQYPGMHSLLVHLLWGAVQQPSFDVIRLYIPMSVHMCNLLWTVLVMSHALASTASYLYVYK